MEWKHAYCQKPWLKFYPDGVPAQIEIPKKTIIEAFDEAVEKWSNKTALVFYGKKITYQKLKDDVDRFANALNHLGVKKGDRVALLLLNSPEFVIAFYGAVKTGAIVMPISPVYVSSEIRHQLMDSGAETIICHDMLCESVENTGLKLKNIILVNITESLPFLKKFVARKVLKGVYERMPEVPRAIIRKKDFLKLEDLIMKYPPNPPTVEIDFDDPVTLQYTGGTTGPPKGSVATHYNLIACEISYHSFMPFDEGKEIIVSYMPFYHGAGVLISLITGIFRGYKQIVLTTPDLDKILNSVRIYGVTYFIGAPAVYELLKNYEKTNRVNWKKLKIVISVADALNISTAKDWQNRRGVCLHEGWGMTECTSGNFGNPIGRARFGSIGIPYPNNAGAIVDDDEDRFVPVGEIGELVMSGPTVTKGYWNNPEATKDCEAIIDGIRWWRTGDLGKMDEDGFFYIYDRKRDLIKYKGLRIFAREVEEVLKSHPKIKDVCVIGVKDITVGQNVKAFVVLESDMRGSLSEVEIIEYCRDKLTPYKIPKIIEFVGEISKTDVGKVSRRELRETME